MFHPCFIRGFFPAVFVLFLASVLPGEAPAQDPLTERYFEQLRNRRLFSVAEQFGADRLSASRNSPAEFIQVSVELSKTYAEHAQYTSGEEHDLYWELAESVLDDATLKHGGSPRSLLLEVQRAFVPALRGEFLRGQIALFPYDAGLQKQTEAVFETALERLKPAESRLARRLRQATLNTPRDREDLQAFEMHDLLDEARFRLAVTLQEFAKTKQTFSPERARSLKEAAPWFKLLSEERSAGPFALRAKIRLAENHRLQNDLNGAETLLSELEQEQLPAELETDLTAERAKWLIANGRLTEAERLLSETRTNAQRPDGELAFLEVQVLVDQWERAVTSQNQKAAEAIQSKIDALVKGSNARVGGYWAYRISSLSEQLEKSRKYGVQVARLVERAEAMYASRQIESAASDYALAADLAKKNGNANVAFELGYTLGSILIQQKNYALASERFRQLAKDFPQNGRAPSAKLLEAYSLGKIYEADPSPANHENYTRALKSHLEVYGEHDSAGDAYWMLGQHEEDRKQNTQALNYYREIPANHRRDLAGQLGVARVYEKVLERHDVLESTAAHEDPKELARILESIRKSRRYWEQAAAKELGRFVASYPAEPEPLAAGQAEVALRFARMQLTRTTPDYRRADSLLERILVSGAQRQAANPPLAEDEHSRWTEILKTARQLRIVSLAGQGLSRRAEMLIEELASSSTENVLGVMDGLMQVAEAADEITRRKLGELQLQTALELNRRRDELNAGEKSRLDDFRAQAYLATGQAVEAVEIYEEMLKARPKDIAFKEKIAGLLTDAGNRQGLLKAKELWRRLEAQAKPGSTDWLERRYMIALCSFKLGEREDCRKLVGVTKLLYHDANDKTNEELWPKFDKLLNLVEN